MTQEKRSPSKGGNGNGGAAGETRALGGKGHGMGLEAGVEALDINGGRQGAQGDDPVSQQTVVADDIRAFMRGVPTLEGGVSQPRRAVGEAADGQGAGITADFAIGEENLRFAVTRP